MKTIKVKLTLTEELLGTASNNPEIHKEFIASKAPDAKSTEDEVAAIGASEYAEKSMTVFHRNASGPILFDYQIKGFFKDSCGSLARVPGTKSNKIKAYKKIIDGTIFVQPRQIPIQLENGASLGNCQRPLRAQTAQGERVALASSETAPPGSVLEFCILLLDEGQESLVKEWLDYGALRGIGQWRNSGKGRFVYEAK